MKGNTKVIWKETFHELEWWLTSHPSWRTVVNHEYRFNWWKFRYMWRMKVISL